ncbi:orotidine-5'-phosphate decarboxylase [Mucilaginibacter lappiensis]|uniref:Orotidine-5'-phosphate decarboxylase n=1 Tax=Mucilaginibacter lappiensis TaxID=354630 RepID=A0A1N7CV52_9SPHI|nr:orotidine-5'-phosphate decarboxylase [Mucilaginibacter lappiensis]MBB6111018.1 orotidine-5'-phosphate decarboxylase [Mucilaginibacter lappiensis]MBB6128856.1 orotidine-5'-phosphate decarboxylase [Mucilaginibacter lappiensis]SIR67344.1 orotidine-5'-phosphate decarboxylase [Mucilaginibacter lappiensis]
MISRARLIEQIKQKKSFLCVGLDTDINKIPEFLKDYPDPILEFNKRIIDATKDLCVSYKPNAAFYEAYGIKGLQSLIDTWKYLPTDTLNIIDAKRGDIGNTSDKYAQAFFDEKASGMSFDAITITPYMGNDSVTPYLAYEGKWIILLALTSSVGSKDFQYLQTGDGYLYETVIQKANTWAGADRIMYVVGATKSTEFTNIRKYAPDNFLLVPGVGAQGGSLEEVCRYGITKECGLIVNASRSIIYASNGEDFADAARAEAQRMQQQMQVELEKAGVI